MEAKEKTSSPGAEVVEGSWISRDIADAQAGLQVELGKHIEDRTETPEED